MPTGAETNEPARQGGPWLVGKTKSCAVLEAEERSDPKGWAGGARKRVKILSKFACENRDLPDQNLPTLHDPKILAWAKLCVVCGRIGFM